jgi:hypothetical protein
MINRTFSLSDVNIASSNITCRAPQYFISSPLCPQLPPIFFIQGQVRSQAAHIRYLDRVLLFKGSLHVYLDCLKRCEDLGGREKGAVGLQYQAEKQGIAYISSAGCADVHFKLAYDGGCQLEDSTSHINEYLIFIRAFTSRTVNTLNHNFVTFS